MERGVEGRCGWLDGWRPTQDNWIGGEDGEVGVKFLSFQIESEIQPMVPFFLRWKCKMSRRGANSYVEEM